MVSDCLAELLAPLEAQLLEWTVALRLQAARAVLAIVQLAGSSLCDHLLRLLPLLRRSRGEVISGVSCR